MSDIRIRIARPEDAAELLQIYSHYVLNTAITFEYDVPTLEEFTSRITNTLKKYPYLVAELDGKIIGYAYAGTFKPRSAYNWAVETTVYIEKNHHGMGTGRKLYDELERYLRLMNITNVNACITKGDVEDEYITNGSPLFHEKMGYRLVGQFTKCGYKFNRWYNMIWMEKFIGEHQEMQPEMIAFSELKI